MTSKILLSLLSTNKNTVKKPSNTSVFFCKTMSWLQTSYMFRLHGRHLASYKYMKKAHFIVSLNIAFQISFKIFCTQPYNAPFELKRAACS